MLVQKDVMVQNHVTETCENFILVGHMFLDMQTCRIVLIRIIGLISIKKSKILYEI